MGGGGVLHTRLSEPKIEKTAASEPRREMKQGATRDVASRLNENADNNRERDLIMKLLKGSLLRPCLDLYFSFTSLQ